MSDKKKDKKDAEFNVEKLENQLAMNLEAGKENPDGIIIQDNGGITSESGQIQSENNIAEKKALGETEDFAVRVARTCHEVNRAYCEGHGDFTQVPWDEAPKWVHESAMQGVKFFHQNPTAGPSAMHDNWCADKLEAGWKYGEEKDPIKKTHPCLVSYRELPFQQKAKDILFLTTVKSFVTSD